MTLLTLALALSSPAQAQSCDKALAAVDAAEGAGLAASFEALARCDAKAAAKAFPKAMTRAGDLDTLIPLVMVAVENDVWNPVWEMIGQITDYTVRDAVAEEVGAACVDRAKVVAFLQGAYFGLKPVEFSEWSDAVRACEAPAFSDWLQQQVASPPNKSYDDKWSTLMNAYVARAGGDALDTLKVAAIKASQGDGPLDTLLDGMAAAVTPNLGKISSEDQARLDGALLEVARQANPEIARRVADRLANSGSDANAATLLPAIYPGRQQADGRFHYAAVAVEAGDCAGTKSALLHTALLTDAGKRYVVQQSAEGPLRAAKARLKKCEVEEPWPVLVSPEPLTSDGELQAFVDSVAAQWAEKGYEVKTRSEARVDLP